MVTQIGSDGVRERTIDYCSAYDGWCAGPKPFGATSTGGRVDWRLGKNEGGNLEGYNKTQSFWILIDKVKELLLFLIGIHSHCPS